MHNSESALLCTLDLSMLQQLPSHSILFHNHTHTSIIHYTSWIFQFVHLYLLTLNFYITLRSIIHTHHNLILLHPLSVLSSHILYNITLKSPPPSAISTRSASSNNIASSHITPFLTICTTLLPNTTLASLQTPPIKTLTFHTLALTHLISKPVHRLILRKACGRRKVIGDDFIYKTAIFCDRCDGALDILEDSMVGMLAALLLPIHTMKEPEMVITYPGLPASKSCGDLAQPHWLTIERKTFVGMVLIVYYLLCNLIGFCSKVGLKSFISY